ncbi:hypothetical protein ACFLSJ_06000 [Verrucomicrobiota bacterium]
MARGTTTKASSTRRAIRNSIAAQMMGGILPTLLRQGGLTALVLIALLGRRAELETGLAFLVMQWGMLARVFAAPHVDGTGRRRFLVLWTTVSAGISALLLVVLPAGQTGPSVTAAWALVGLLAVYFLALHTAGAAWFPLLHAFLPASLRGRYFGNMRRWWQMASYGAVFLCGIVLGRDPDMGRFFVVLLPAVLLQFGRAFMYSRLPEGPPPEASTGNRRRLLVPLRDREFRHFLAFVSLTGLAQHAVLPFVVPFLRSELGFPASLTLYGTACLGLGSVVSLVGWGRLADRHGTRLVFLLGCLLAVASFVTLACVPSYAAGPGRAAVVAVAGLVVSGAGTAGIGIAYTVRLMRMTPERDASPYLNVTQAALGTVAGLAAALTGCLLRWLPEELSFGGMSVSTFRLFFLGAAAWLLVMLVEVRKLPRMGEPGIRRMADATMERLFGSRAFRLGD